MESLLDPVELNRETTQALDEIRSGVDNALYGAPSADAEERIYRFVLPLIEDAGLPTVHVIHYRWYLRELARHWRTRQCRDLAFHLELCVRKWVHLGLEPRTLQFLICEAHQRLKGKDLTTKSQRHEEPAKTGTVPRVERSEGLSPAFAPETPHAESADVRSALTPRPSPLTPDIETAKDAKIAKVPSSGPQIPPQSLTPDPQPLTLESAKSVDVS